MPFNSSLVAYSLGGLLLLDQLIKVPKLQQQLGDIECRGVPMKGSHLATFSQTWLGGLINFCLGVSEISHGFPELMNSLGAFSAPCMKLCESVGLLSNIHRIKWYCGLGRDAENYLCLGDGDGAVDGFMAHPEICYMNPLRPELIKSSSFNIQFDAQADHQMIRHTKNVTNMLDGYQSWAFPCQKIDSLRFSKSWLSFNSSEMMTIKVNQDYFEVIHIPTTVIKSDLHLGFKQGGQILVHQSLMQMIPVRPTMVIWAFD